VSVTALDELEQPRAVAARVTAEIFNEDWLREYLESVKQLSRGYPVDHKCSECGKRQKVYVHVPDFKNINESVIDFWNQAFGRPGTAEGEPGGVTIIVHRHWPGGESE
jgi:hypothetical protein